MPITIISLLSIKVCLSMSLKLATFTIFTNKCKKLHFFLHINFLFRGIGGIAIILFLADPIPFLHKFDVHKLW